MSDSATIVLPWPSRELSPNSRCHWARKATKVKKARHMAQMLALEAGVRHVEARSLNVAVTFFPPDNRRRDTDNAIAACKGFFDGIADVCGVDDSRWSMSFKRGEPKPPGAVRIDIEVAA